MFGREVHSAIYFIALACLAASLSLSVFATSLFLLILLGNWVLEGRYAEKWLMFRNRPSIWLIISVYVLFLGGLLYTDDFSYGLHDLRIKLPILALVVIMGTTPSISPLRLKWIILALVAGVTIGSLASMAALTGIIDVQYKDMREISLFVSHIRFSLLINVAIFSLIYMIFKREFSPKTWEPPVYTGLMIWLVIFLFVLQSITGILIFLVVTFVVFWIYLHRVWSLLLRWTLAVLMLAALMMGMFMISKSMGRFYNVERVDPGNIEQYTAGGRNYVHDFTNPFVENGYYIWLYLCEPELEKEWNRLSSKPYHGLDDRGHEIKYTLIRYMTSLGLRKDSVGVNSLSPNDIQSIEQGAANILYGKKWSFHAKIYEILWQIDVYRKGGNPSGHSVTQRILYFEAAFGIIRDNFWTGVGTGDVVNAYRDYYERTGSPLSKPWRLRAHNQFLTFIVTYGIIGFTWIMIGIIYPVFLEGRNREYLIWMFLMVALLSWLNEDTLETHTGVTFFGFFYSLFLYAARPGEEPSN